MPQLDFDPSDYSVSFQAKKIHLLAKEYALLQFLYRNRGQVFSRKQLLDEVWPMEYPVERTVDDHIYRLRKKLSRWSSYLFLNTVRGYGYSLALKESDLRNPSMEDAEFQEQLQKLLNKYLLYGQGKSMITLANQQELLGFELDLFHHVFIRFVQADLDWFLEDTKVPDTNKLYYLLHFYLYFYNEPKASLAYFERTIAAKILPLRYHRELELLNILGLYSDNGRYQEDLYRLKAGYEANRNSGGEYDFGIHLKLSEMYIHLIGDHPAEAEQCAGEIEQMLSEAPYLREICSYHGLKGRLLLLKGKREEAAAALHYGLEVGEMTDNVPLIVSTVRETLFFLENKVSDPQLHRQFAAKYAELDDRYHLTAYKERIAQKIEDILGAV